MPGMLDHPYRDAIISSRFCNPIGAWRAAKAGFRSPCSPAFRQHPSEERDTIGLEALPPVDHFYPNPLAGAEGIDAAPAQGGDVNEHVLATAVGRNETVAFFSLEPLYRALHRRGGLEPAAVDRAGAAMRYRRRTVVDVQDVGHQRTLRSSADLAAYRSAFAHVLVAGATQYRHWQESVLRSVGERNESETLAGVEPLDFGFDAVARGGVLAKEAGAAFVHSSSKRAIECGERTEHRIIA